MAKQTAWTSGPSLSIPAAVLSDRNLKARAKLILASLSALANRTGRTKPISKGEIASMCGLSATNLAREIRELVATGWLEVERQPGSSSIYQLREPTLKLPQASHPQPCPTAQAPSPQVTSRTGTVSRMERHTNFWLVSFALDDGASVSTIFQGGRKPCSSGDTANLEVRDWLSRLSIAGGSESGVHWLNHSPEPWEVCDSIEIVVSEIARYATPAGRIFVSLQGGNEKLTTQVHLPETSIPAGLRTGAQLRISRRDGLGIEIPTCGDSSPQMHEGVLPRIEISGELFVVEASFLPEYRSAA